MLDFSTYPPLVDYAPGVDMDALESAAEMVRRECGWHIAPSVIETLVLDSDGGRLLEIPSLHVTAVSAVTDAGDVPLEGWEWSANGVLERTRLARWPRGRRAVKVSLTHGLAVAPTDLVGYVADVARDLAGVASTPRGGLAQIGPFRFDPSRPWDADRSTPLARYRRW